PRIVAEDRKACLGECVRDEHLRVHQPFLAANDFMYSTRAPTQSMLTALYVDTRIPPTERCPLRPTIPFFFASATNWSSSASVGRRNTTFIRLRLPCSMGHR